MSELFAALISFFLVQPLQAELRDSLAAARVPAAVAREVTACATTAAPAMIDRALGDPWWAVDRGVRLWTGMISAEAALREAAPGCTRAIDAARPFLRGEAA